MVLVAVILVTFVFLFKDNLLKKIYPKTYSEAVLIYQEKYKIDENLIYALIKAESNFKQEAVSNKEAIGVMQLMEETAKDVARKNAIELDFEKARQELFDINKNIEIGTCYLATLLERYQNKEVALAAYNAGIGTVDRLD